MHFGLCCVMFSNLTYTSTPYPSFGIPNFANNTADARTPNPKPLSRRPLYCPKPLSPKLGMGVWQPLDRMELINMIQARFTDCCLKSSFLGSTQLLGQVWGPISAISILDILTVLCDLWSQLIVSVLISPTIVSYIVPSTTPLQENFDSSSVMEGLYKRDGK